MLSYDSAVPNGQDQAAGAQLPSPSVKPVTTTTPSRGAVVADGQTQHQRLHHLWLVTGPAGCGKTTVAEYLANALNIPYIEGDLVSSNRRGHGVVSSVGTLLPLKLGLTHQIQYHPQANIDKMSTGVPLTDADRWDWLTELRKQSNSRIHDGAEGVVVACSALKLKYRDVIRVAAYWDRTILIHFIFLHAPAELLLKRVTAREGHYMGADMVKSQFDILERPREDEIDVITVDASRDVDQVKQDALEKVNALLAVEE
jgi:gluconokinase